VLAALLGAVGLLLALGCANAAGLLSTRSSRRRAELALRRCLGAGAWRIVHQQLIEGVLLAGLAGTAGTLIGYLGVSWLWPLRPAALSRFPDVPFDGVVLLFAAVVALVAGVVFTLIGASRLPAPDELVHAPGPMSFARSGPCKRHLVPALEIAVTVVLLFAAGLLARSVVELRRVDLGFDPADQLTFRVALSTQRFPEATERTRLAHLIEEEIGALEGVNAVGGSSHLPFDDVPNWSSPAAPEGTPDAELEAHYVDHRSVTPGFLAALGARLVDGRVFELNDSRRDGDVVVIDRALADRHWPDQPAVGRTLIVTQYRDGEFVPIPATVIGVVETMRRHDMSAPGDGVVFLPFAQSARWQLSFVVRASEQDGLPERVREKVAGLGAGLAASDFRPLHAWVDEATATLRLAAILGQVFALVAAILAFAGLYTVLALAVAQRRAEIGLRMALGAQRGAIFRGVVVEGLLVATAGVAAGTPVALTASRHLVGLLVVGSHDPVTAVLVVGAIVVVATAATAVPAWSAAGADPARTLRG
jgi:predicted permease